MEQSTTPEDSDPPGAPARPPGREIRLRTVSVVEAAADALREMILDGTIEPGTRLRETEFAGRLGIARHTFRAAAQILINEGLLRRSPNRGVQLSVLDAGDIVDIFRLREALEIEARFTARDDDASWRTVVDLDMDFHRAIIDATGSERISRAYAGVQSEILLCMAQLRPHYDRPDEVAAEHRELLEALQAGEPDEVEKLFRRHLGDASENLTNALQAREEVTA
ncbi:MAG: GntR family transcriptional regulator [Acidobacteria bacterium]|nr:MAG: GntR family transcriptional regulator [Acidobacteriota bacterium]